MVQTPTNKITARKHGRNGTRYASGNTAVIFWPCGTRYASIVLRAGFRPIRSFHQTRADAAYLAGEWMDPEQDGRFILNNDDAAMGRAVAV